MSCIWGKCAIIYKPLMHTRTGAWGNAARSARGVRVTRGWWRLIEGRGRRASHWCAFFLFSAFCFRSHQPESQDMHPLYALICTPGTSCKSLYAPLAPLVNPSYMHPWHPFEPSLCPQGATSMPLTPIACPPLLPQPEGLKLHRPSWTPTPQQTMVRLLHISNCFS